METQSIKPKSSNRKIFFIIGGVLLGLCVLCLIVVLISNAINPPAAKPTTDVNAIYTSAVQTVIAQKIQPTQAIPPTAPAPVSTNTPEPTATTASLPKIGERIVQGDYALTVANAEKSQNYGYLSAKAGNTLVAVEIIIESNAATGVSVNPIYATIKDADGYTYNADIVGGKEPSLNSQNDMPIGEKMRGWITFEIPASAKGLVLTYEPISFGNTTRIRVDLGQ